ncbi:hypothetical protein HDU76_004199, partial [Blyttiomyces sp. JEL0837]
AIMNAIYESLPFSTRFELNQRAAERLESMLNESNEEIMLPWVCFHFSRSQNYVKAIKYLDQLGCLYVKKCTFSEAIVTFEKLLAIANANLKGTGLPNEIERLRRGNWLSNCAYSYATRRNGTNSVTYALEAIQEVHPNPWPVDEADIKKRFLKSMVHFLVLWVKTRHGTKPVHQLAAKIGPKKISNNYVFVTREQILEQAMMSIYLASVYNPSIMSSMVALAMMEVLCMVIVRAYRDLPNWRVTLARSAFAFHFPLKPLAKLLFKAALKLENVGEPSFAHHFSFGANIHFPGVTYQTITVAYV